MNNFLRKLPCPVLSWVLEIQWQGKRHAPCPYGASSEIHDKQVNNYIIKSVRRETGWAYDRE